MPRKRLLSDAQLEEMATLRERGWHCARIAQHFTEAGTPISKSSIYWQCLRLGVEPPRHLRGRQGAPATAYRRCGNTVRPWTPDEDDRLLQLERTTSSLNLVARQLGRANSSVRGRLATLARTDARREEASVS